MSNIRYIPVEKNPSQQSFVFPVQFAIKTNGYWVASLAAIPECAALGTTKDEALAMLTHTARAYVRLLRDTGTTLPASVEMINAPVVAVTL
jgi:predicted RNase H-like HicB family nuclease